MKINTALFYALLLLWNNCDLLDEQVIDISGKVTNDGDPVGGAIVLLVNGTDISDGLSLTNGSISMSNGKYTIFDVDPGDYYVLAIEDNNGNQEFDADTDRLGFHGVVPENLDLIPDEITVDDSDLENIDIVDLYSLE